MLFVANIKNVSSLFRRKSGKDICYLEWIGQVLDTNALGTGSAQDNCLLVVVENNKILARPRLLVDIIRQTVAHLE